MRSFVTIIGSPRIYHCEPAWRWEPHPFDDFDLWIVLEGRGWLEHDGEHQVLSPGCGAIFQPGEKILASHDPAFPLVVFACHFTSAVLSKKVGSGRVFGRITGLECLRGNAELAVRFYEEDETGAELAQAVIGQLILHVLHVIDRDREPGIDSRFMAISLEIRSRPGFDWTIDDMARQCGCSIPHFRKAFRLAFGIAPMQFVIRQRIIRAISLLRESSMTLQTIADALGYGDIYFFHRQFRQVAGTTPRAVRLGAKTALDSSVR